MHTSSQDIKQEDCLDYEQKVVRQLHGCENVAFLGKLYPFRMHLGHRFSGQNTALLVRPSFTSCNLCYVVHLRRNNCGFNLTLPELKSTTTTRSEIHPAVSHASVERKMVGLNCYCGVFRRNRRMCRQQLMMTYDTDSVALELHASLNGRHPAMHMQPMSAKRKCLIER